MFGKFFKKQTSQPSQKGTGQQGASEPSADEAILNFLITEYRARFPENKGVHVETILSTLGALAGFGCQMGAREVLVKTGRAKEEEVFMVVETKDGQKYYCGDFLNEPLFSTQQGTMSVWLLVASAAKTLGAKTLPDVAGIVKYYNQTLGSEQFFTPQLPQKHMPRILPSEALGYWAATRNLQMKHGVEPLHWGWTYAVAAQKLMMKSKAFLEPSLGAQIVMEAAVPMSKFDPARVEGA